jgi:hypothetical protein
LAWKTLELLLDENFDEAGRQRPESLACKLTDPCSSKSRKLKVITLE